MTLYDVLEVGENATVDEIRKAYRRMAMVAHPDQGGTDEHFRAVQSAYDILSDPFKRGMYDLKRVTEYFHKQAAYKSPKKPPTKTATIRLTTLRHRSGFRTEHYVRTQDLIESLDAAAEFYKGADATEAIHNIVNAIMRIANDGY